jgi:hypothetical protein
MIAAVPAGLFLLSAIGCSVSAEQDEMTVGTAEEAATACPSPSAQDDQMRAAATAAMNVMKDAADQAGTMAYPTQAYSILAPQRYRIQSSGTGIEFDPTDQLYGNVTNAMKAHLAFAQLDTSVGKFLSDGLKYAYANTDGQTFPNIVTIPALRTYKYPGPVSVGISDQTSSDNSHTATVSGKAWCGTSVVTIADTVRNSWQYSPMYAGNITLWRGNVPAGFKGTKHTPWTPFNGALAAGNPYLVVSVNGKPTNWATYNFAALYCYDYPNNQCSGTIEIDPVPYAEPGEYYNTTGVVGTQANPFALSPTVLFAVSDHTSQWATRTVNGVQEWGTFTQPVTLFGVTQYRYTKKM